MKIGIKHRPAPGLPQVPPGHTCCGIAVRQVDGLPGIAEARGSIFRRWIAVNAAWCQFPAREQEALLLHEVWHCRRFHLEARWLFLLFSWLPAILWLPFAQWVSYRQEFAADRFAKKEGYGRELARALSRITIYDSTFHPSPQARIAALEN